MCENGWVRKLRLISKLMTSQPGKQIIATKVFLNILRCKDSQTMKFNQLIEHNARSIFRQKIMQKMRPGG